MRTSGVIVYASKQTVTPHAVWGSWGMVRLLMVVKGFCRLNTVRYYSGFCYPDTKAGASSRIQKISHSKTPAFQG